MEGNEYLLAYQLKDSDITLIRNIAELLEEIGDKNHSIEFWEKLTKIEPNNKIALEKIAEFKENIGDYRGEIDILEQLYGLDNKKLLVIKKLAKAYEKIKNKEKALEFYNKFVSISPVNEYYEQAKEKIKKLESIDMEEDEGLLGKIIKIFNKQKS